MLKAEELKILEQIEKLIDHAGADSYIRMTFAGIVEVCRRNIEDDFGDSPVEDCANMRVALDAERRMHDEDKRLLDKAQRACRETLDMLDEARRDAEGMQKRIAELEEERDAMADSVQGLQEILDKSEAEATNAIRMNNKYEEIVAEKDMEILRLKAEIYDLRKEH